MPQSGASVPIPAEAAGHTKEPNMRPTDCPSCWGAGDVLREDTRNNDRLFCWPCPHGCAPGGVALVRTTVTPDRARKMAAKMLRKAAGTR